MAYHTNKLFINPLHNQEKKTQFAFQFKTGQSIHTPGNKLKTQIQFFRNQSNNQFAQPRQKATKIDYSY